MSPLCRRNRKLPGAAKQMEPKLELRQPRRHISDRLGLCHGSASELSRSVSDASVPDPEKNAPMDGTSAENVLPLSVPNRGSGRVGALQPKLNDDQRAQAVTGLAHNAHSSREGPVCVLRIRREHPAGAARALAGSAASLLEVPGFFFFLMSGRKENP